MLTFAFKTATVCLVFTTKKLHWYAYHMLDVYLFLSWTCNNLRHKATYIINLQRLIASNNIWLLEKQQLYDFSVSKCIYINKYKDWNHSGSSTRNLKSYEIISYKWKSRLFTTVKSYTNFKTACKTIFHWNLWWMFYFTFIFSSFFYTSFSSGFSDI